MNGDENGVDCGILIQLKTFFNRLFFIPQVGVVKQIVVKIIKLFSMTN